MQYDKEDLNAAASIDVKPSIQCNSVVAEQNAKDLNSVPNGNVIDVSISPNGRASIIDGRNRITSTENLNNDLDNDNNNDNTSSNNFKQEDEYNHHQQQHQQQHHHNDQQLQFDEPEQMRKLFIGGLDYKTSEETLRQHFEKFGDVIDCVVMREPQTRRSRGFGFVTYARSSMVDKAQEARPHRVDGREVEPKRAIPRGESGKPETQATVKKVFLGGLSDNLNESDLREYFKDFGNIVNISIATQKDTGKKRGFAFVEFDDYDPVDKIVLKKHHLIKETRLEVKKAIPKIDMDARRGDPKMAVVGNMSVISGHPFHSPGSRGGHRGPRNSGYVWDNGPYPGAGNYPLNYSSQASYGYQPHYQSPSHYGTGNWMVYGHGGGSSRGAYTSGSYGRGYIGAEGGWTTADHTVGHNGHSASQGGAGGPMRLSYQYRGSGPYGSGYGTHRRNYNP